MVGSIVLRSREADLYGAWWPTATQIGHARSSTLMTHHVQPAALRELGIGDAMFTLAAFRVGPSALSQMLCAFVSLGLYQVDSDVAIMF